MLEENITNVPQFYEVEKEEQLQEIKDKIRFPVILKPASGLGSLNVYRINNIEELEEKISEVIRESFNKKALIETFIEGQEYGVETLYSYNLEQYCQNTVSIRVDAICGMKDCIDNGTIKTEDKVMISGFGVGLSWGGTVLLFR